MKTGLSAGSANQSRQARKLGSHGLACNRTRTFALLDMETASPELVLVPDEELRRLAEERGPTSSEAQVLVQLASQRAQDLQVYAFRAGDQYVTGPLPKTTETASPDELLDALHRASTGKE